MEGVTDSGKEQIYAQRMTLPLRYGDINGDITLDGGYRCLSPGFSDSTKIVLLDASYTKAFSSDLDASLWL